MVNDYKKKLKDKQKEKQKEEEEKQKKAKKKIIDWDERARIHKQNYPEDYKNNKKSKKKSNNFKKKEKVLDFNSLIGKEAVEDAAKDRAENFRPILCEHALKPCVKLAKKGLNLVPLGRNQSNQANDSSYHKRNRVSH